MDLPGAIPNGKDSAYVEEGMYTCLTLLAVTPMP